MIWVFLTAVFIVVAGELAQSEILRRVGVGLIVLAVAAVIFNLLAGLPGL